MSITRLIVQLHTDPAPAHWYFSDAAQAAEAAKLADTHRAFVSFFALSQVPDVPPDDLDSDASEFKAWLFGLHDMPQQADAAPAGVVRYVLVTDTVCQGRILAERDGDSKPIVYATRREAEAEVADSMVIQYQQVIDGERSLDEVGEPDGIEAVVIDDDGTIRDDFGHVFGNVNQPLPY